MMIKPCPRLLKDRVRELRKGARPDTSLAVPIYGFESLSLMVQFVYNLKPEKTFPSLTVLFLLYKVDPITGHPNTLQGTLARTCPSAPCFIRKKVATKKLKNPFDHLSAGSLQ